jgi:hypothetical protein
MSNPDKPDENTGDDDRSFLTRWSQRKRGAEQPDRDAPVAKADVPASVVEADAEPAFDLSSLPKLEELTASTDITGFLGKGVPEHLRNAALRKSWALDPAIRNYVNPALDYAYDWNTPGGVPGSSELGAGMDVARLVSQIMGSGESPVETAVSAAQSADAPAGASAPVLEGSTAPKSEPEFPTQALRTGTETISQKPSNAEAAEGAEAEQTRRCEEADPAAPQQPVRRHGSAKPLV